MDNNKRGEIKIRDLSLEDATQRIEHQFEMLNARMDAILLHLETINANLHRKLVKIGENDPQN